MRLVELSHVLGNGMPTYPGIKPSTFGALVTHEASRARYDDKAEFYLGWAEMSGNCGTYLDSPFHRYEDGADLSAVPLEAVAGLDGMVVDHDPARRSVELVSDGDLGGKAVLFRTGWDRRWGTPEYWGPGPYLGADAVDALIAAGPALVGVDFSNVDDTEDPARPVHTRLLREGILIVEHMRDLSALPRAGFRLFAVPLRIVGGASFPVRAFAEIPR